MRFGKDIKEPTIQVILKRKPALGSGLGRLQRVLQDLKECNLVNLRWGR